MRVMRQYQNDGAGAVIGQFEAGVRSTLLVLPTGCGKTVVFAKIAEALRPRYGRTLVLAHRDELIRQAVEKIGDWTSLSTAVEMGGERADGLLGGAADVVVASVQTLARSARRARFAPDAFGLVVIDEGHHATAKSYKAIREHFPNARVLLVTATPDRGDGVGLKTVCESTAFIYEIRDAIEDRYLVPVKAKAEEEIEGLDFSALRKTAGDLNEHDLEELLTRRALLEAMSRATIEAAAGRPTLVFGVTVEHAHSYARAINDAAGGDVAIALDGTADRDRRREVLELYKARRYQFLVNCALFTEGFDHPPIACVSIARPTLVRGLYAQMVGRGTRPWCPEGCSTYCEHPTRKLDLLVHDFAGNAGRHSLIGIDDVLDGCQDVEVKARAKKLRRRFDLTVLESLDRAAEELAGEARRKVTARFQQKAVDPFALLGIRPRAGRWGGVSATPPQLELLGKLGFPEDEGKKLDKGQASKTLDELLRRRKEGLCTFKMAKTLAKHGLNPDLTFDDARAALDALAANNWTASAEIIARFGVVRAAGAA